MSKVELNDEIREKLLGKLPMNSDDTIEYRSDIFSDLTEEEKELYTPLFIIKGLSAADIIKVKQHMIDDYARLNSKKKQKVVDSKSEIIEIIHNSIVDIKNLINPNSGEIIEYDGKNTLKDLPEILINDVFNKIVQISGFIG